MTENETVILLSHMYLPSFDEEEKQALSKAIKALQEIQQYRAIGTIDECRKAMERQIPKKITHEATFYKCCTCPSCKNVVDEFETWGDSKVRVKFKYCHFCGQKLDWSE